MQQPDDFIAGLGFLALGTRLKRLAEQLQTGVAEVLAEAGSPLQPGQLPLLMAIDEGGGLSIAGLVQAVGISQPSVSRAIRELERSRLVTLEADRRDGRIRRPVLTTQGRGLLDHVRTSLFPQIAAAAKQLCEGEAMLDSLAALEKRNRALPFAERIRRTAA
jgi:DNA-binding MarR family transcriptional regulator